MIVTIATAILTVLIILLIGGVVYLVTDGKIGMALYHDAMGWHRPDKTLDYDGCSYVARCRYCGKKILQDSQGNWFECRERKHND